MEKQRSEKIPSVLFPRSIKPNHYSKTIHFKLCYSLNTRLKGVKILGKCIYLSHSLSPSLSLTLSLLHPLSLSQKDLSLSLCFNLSFSLSRSLSLSLHLSHPLSLPFYLSRSLSISLYLSPLYISAFSRPSLFKVCRSLINPLSPRDTSGKASRGFLCIRQAGLLRSPQPVKRLKPAEQTVNPHISSFSAQRKPAKFRPD